MRFILKIILIVSFLAETVNAARIKDLANIMGVRENMLIGYGLVAGLDGTGDSKSPFTNKSLSQMLRRMGVEVTDAASKNVAAVIVTATLPSFPRVGNKIDVTISSIGDAKSLQGGTLLVTPLKANSQDVYAVAQGPLSIGGFAAKGNKSSSQKNHVTVASIPNGAIIERELQFTFNDINRYTLALHNPDFSTAARVVHVINQDLGGKYAIAIDPGTVQVYAPHGYTGGSVEFLAMIESLDVIPDMRAKVVINERTGTVVMGQSVKISTVAITHGGLSIEIKSSETTDVMGQRTVTETTTANEDTGAKVMVLKGGSTIQDLAKSLNAMGVTPRDLITVFQAVKSAGALQAELVIM